jgi:hypothetical protein
VHDKLMSNMDKIPPDVTMPLVKPVAVDDVPVVTVTLWSEDVDDGALRTLARVSHEPADPSQMVAHYTGPAYEGKNPVADSTPAVTIAIAKKEKTNGVVVANALLANLDSLKGELIPSNVHVEVARNYGKTANDKVNELLEAMLEAAFFVSVLCLYGLGVRAAFVVITVIPIVILVTIWWAMMVDYLHGQAHLQRIGRERLRKTFASASYLACTGLRSSERASRKSERRRERSTAYSVIAAAGKATRTK